MENDTLIFEQTSTEGSRGQFFLRNSNAPNVDELDFAAADNSEAGEAVTFTLTIYPDTSGREAPSSLPSSGGAFSFTTPVRLESRGCHYCRAPIGIAPPLVSGLSTFTHVRQRPDVYRLVTRFAWPGR
jgi:hypothetical protein